MKWYDRIILAVVGISIIVFTIIGKLKEEHRHKELLLAVATHHEAFVNRTNQLGSGLEKHHALMTEEPKKKGWFRK